MRRSEDFSAAVRTGRRSGRTCMVVHLRVDAGDCAPRAGFVVSKAVGGAVVRNAVTRRLRALVRVRLDRLPAGCDLVVRALPLAAQASSAELGTELDQCLATLLRAPAPAGVARP
jgi:ribonuclease P protein component